MPLTEHHLDHAMAAWRDYWQQCGAGYPCQSALRQFLNGGAQGAPWRSQIPNGVEFGGPETVQRVQHIQDGMRKLEGYHAKLACAVWLYYFLSGRDAGGGLIKNGDRAALLGVSEPVYLNQVRRGKDFLLGFL